VDAAHTPDATSLRRAAQILDDASARVLGADTTPAVRTRLETELGRELARLLVQALVERETRAGSLSTGY